MSSPMDVNQLSDEDLYKELKNRGFPAGPVVASTRNLYRRKLLEILDQEDGQEDANEQEEEEEEEEEIEDQWSHISPKHNEEPRSRLSPQQRLSYGQDDISTRTKPFPSSSIFADRERDSIRSHSSYLESHETSRLGGPSAYLSSTSSIFKDDPLARYRKPLSDTSFGRTDLASRYRYTGYSDGLASKIAPRGNRQKSNANLRMILCACVVVAAFVMLYFVYNAWSDNDPYRQIEEDARRIIEESTKKNFDN